MLRVAKSQKCVGCGHGSRQDSKQLSLIANEALSQLSYGPKRQRGVPVVWVSAI
jgi:hypothetical protein